MFGPLPLPAAWRAAPGEGLPDLAWSDDRGRRLSLCEDRHAGRPAVLFVCASAAAAEAAQGLRALAGLQPCLAEAGVLLFGITGAGAQENRACAERWALPFPLLCDTDFALGRACGLAAPGVLGAAETWAVLLLDPNRRIERLITAASAGGDLAASLHAALDGRQAAWGGPAVTACQPPVLLRPRVLDPEDCCALIAGWEEGGVYRGGVASDRDGGHALVEAVKRRVDVALPDRGPLAQVCFDRFRRRLFPEIRKAFQFAVTRTETLRLGCYSAEERGCFKAHRDDTSRHTAHRRFAVSINLNTGDYEGGALRFPEYGPQLYAPEAGGAVVFSCSLLHEALPVTAGRRFGLFGFFFGETEEALRQQQPGKAPATRVDGD